MKTAFLTVSLSFALFVVAFAQTEKGTLIVKVQNIESKNGALLISLVNKAEDFLSDRTFRAKKESITNTGEMEVVFKEVPFGEYAIAIYHDKNNNGELDRFMGMIPQEPYGISNDAKGKMGPPKYEDAKFDFNKSMKIIIKLNN